MFGPPAALGGEGEVAKQGVSDGEEEDDAGNAATASDGDALEAMPDAELGVGPFGDAAGSP